MEQNGLRQVLRLANAFQVNNLRVAELSARFSPIERDAIAENAPAADNAGACNWRDCL
jgi:hypothetical protein